MTKDIEVGLLKELGLSTVVIDGQVQHLLHLKALNGNEATFAIGNDELSAFVIRAQDALVKGLGYAVNSD